MLGLDEVADITGHEVGGVCPFGLKTPLPVIATFRCGRSTSWCRRGLDPQRVRIAPSRMAELTSAEWVDVCQPQRSRPAACSGGKPVGKAKRTTRCSTKTRQAMMQQGGGQPLRFCPPYEATKLVVPI